IPMTTADFYGKYDLLKAQLKRTGVVVETAESIGPVTGIWSENGGFDWKSKDPMMNKNFATLNVTQEFGKTIGWQFVDGRDFIHGYTSDSSGFVINESAAKLMALKNPIGEIVHADNIWFKNENFRILGVVKDMVMNSPFEPASPTIFFLKPEGFMNRFFVKINPNVSAAKALPKIESVFRQLIPAAPFEYSFADEQYAAKFADEERIGILASFFAALAVFISCLGLFGLASFVAAQRSKEISVRKVLGASMFAVWTLLSKDFLMLIIISCLIAIPLAGYFMSEWLSKYEYRTQISWWIFAAAIVGALLITLLTISYQAIKAALANPVDSLRTQ
ncbi:MAG TPA: FtsX-like permease family protein, partial [Puia sp.]|nr:FtsX-like permease family protein [Puia sp.]